MDMVFEVFLIPAVSMKSEQPTGALGKILLWRGFSELYGERC